MHTKVKCQVFRRGQRHTRGRDTLYRRIVCQIHEQNGSVDRAGAAKIRSEEFRFFVRNTDGREYDREIALAASDLRLPRDLRREIRVRQTGGRKDRQLLSSDQGVQTVYRRYTGLDKFGWVITCSRIHRQAVDIQIFFGDQRRTAVLRTTHPVEHAAEHIR